MSIVEINGRKHSVDLPGDTPLLWVLRDALGYTGTKYGCGMGLCGTCIVHVDGQPAKSCLLPLEAAAGRSITTVEAASEDPVGRAVQQAWLSAGVAQCGYCQSGQIMSAIALLKARPNPSAEEIDTALSGNICRCGTYLRVRRAIVQAAESLNRGGQPR